MGKVKLNKGVLKGFKFVAIGALSISIFGASAQVDASTVQPTNEKTNVAAVNSIHFKDVNKNYWATDSIEWAVTEKIVSGYADGTFRPNDLLTEDQFTTMLVRFYSDLGKEVELVKNNGVNNSTKNKYDGLAHFKIPLLGYDNSSFRKSSVNRGLIAQVFSYLQGNHSDLEDAVEYLFEEGITSGSNPNGKTTIDKFGATDQLTRAQAVAFFKRIHDAGAVSIHPEVMADKLVIDTKTEALSVIIEKTIVAKKEAMIKVDATSIPSKKELVEAKQQLIKEKNTMAKAIGVQMSDIGKAISEAKRSGDVEKITQLLSEKKTLIQEKKEQGKETGKQMSEMGQAIGEAKRAGDETKAQELIDEKKQFIEEKRGQNNQNNYQNKR